MAIDLAGPFPLPQENGVPKFQLLLVVVDVCTRFVFLRPIISKEAAIVGAELYKLFCDIGFPQVLQSDNGTEFKNSTIRTITNLADIDHRFISAYHPRAIGVAECYVQTAKQTISKLIRADNSTWYKEVPGAQFVMNAKIASLHGSTPFSLFFGRRLRTATTPHLQSALLSEDELNERVDYLTNLVYPAISDGVQARQTEAAEAFRRKHRLNVKDNPFPDGSYVMTIDPKLHSALQPRYEGPYKVLRRNQGGAYILEDLTGALLDSTCAPTRMKLIRRDTVEDDADIFTVQQILDDKVVPHPDDPSKEGEKQYKVRWKGYSPEHDSWIPFANFIELGMIEKYRRRRYGEDTTIKLDNGIGSSPEASTPVQKMPPERATSSRLGPMRRSMRKNGDIRV